MSDQTPEAVQQPPVPTLPNGDVIEDPLVATNALLRAVRRAAEASAAAQDTREMDEGAKAALAFAQAIVTLDPTRLAGGDTPEARVAATPPQMPAVRDGDRDGQIGEK